MWLRLSERIDASSLRERAVMFGAAALLLVTFVDQVFIEPQFVKVRRAASEVAEKQGEIKSLQAEIAKLLQGLAVDPDLANRQHIAQLSAKVGEVERKIAAEQAKFTAPEQMKAVVQELLSRNRRIKLVDMKTLPLTTIASAREQDGRAGPATAGAADRQVYRHGIELTVSGTYLDLLSYVSDLERLPTQLYWGSLELSVSEYPTVMLKLTVYTLSLEKSWMSV